MTICPTCKEQQWSVMDQKYVELNVQCWSCDMELWKEGKLTLAEFEKRERVALTEKMI